MTENAYCLFHLDTPAWWWPPCLPSSEWAAWLQAVGALVGIAVAIFVVRHQLAATRRAAFMVDIQRIASRRLLLDAIHTNASKILRANLDAAGADESLRLPSYVESECTQAIQALGAVAWESATNGDELTVLLMAREPIAVVARLVEGTNFGKRLHRPQDEDDLDRALKHIDSLMQVLHEEALQLSLQ